MCYDPIYPFSAVLFLNQAHAKRLRVADIPYVLFLASNAAYLATYVCDWTTRLKKNLRFEVLRDIIIMLMLYLVLAPCGFVG
jgi:hypothetical protein